MSNLIAAVVALAIHGALAGALQWSVQQAQVPPAGRVTIVQLSDATGLPVYADLRAEGAGAPGRL